MHPRVNANSPDAGETDGGEIPQRSWLIKLVHPTREERRKLLILEAWALVAFSYVVVVFAYAWPPDYRNANPAYVAAAWTAFMVRTFVFHFGLVLLVIASICAFVRRWKLLIACLPLLGMTLGPSLVLYLPGGANRPAGGADGHADHADPGIVVMSVNLLAVNEQTAPILAEIERADPDILLLQEYTDHWHQAIQSSLADRYPHSAYVIRDDSFGAAVYSKRPFVGKPERYVPLGSATEPQLRAVIRVDGREIAVYNIHLLPPWGMEYVIETRRQFADLLDRLRDEPLPTIVAGDYNFTENSPHASDLARLGFRDAQDVGGWGRGTTWPVHGFFRWIPRIRLDHIYISRELTCTDCRTGKGEGSDHRPVIARIILE